MVVVVVVVGVGVVVHLWAFSLGVGVVVQMLAFFLERGSALGGTQNVVGVDGWGRWMGAVDGDGGMVER